MDNYKYSSAFEDLAIKILENYLEVSLDHTRTKTTKRTRDYGVDSFVYIENETENIIRTIEAKLRASNYTLALKDIATSVIFFILRHGDEHYIITNVFLTDGTKEAIVAINNNNPGSIHYIDGEVTKDILENILVDLKEDELLLANHIINDFPNLKTPKRSKNNTRIDNSKNLQLYESRQVCLNTVISEFKEKTWVTLSGSLGVGKHVVAQKASIVFNNNDYLIININALSNNLVSNFCGEITKGLFGTNIDDLVLQVQEDDKHITDALNDSEKNNLSILYKIFNTNGITRETSRYLAKNYLLNLFKSFSSNKYFIIIDNFDSVSEDLFHLLSELSVENNTNFKILSLTSTNSINYVNYFSYEFKRVHYKSFKEIKLLELDIEESIKYITSLNNQIKKSEAELIFNYIGGNPSLILEFIKSNTNLLAVSTGKFNYTDLHTFYNLEIESNINTDIILFLYFLIFALDGISDEEITKCFYSDDLNSVINYISNSPLFSYYNNKYNFKSQYIKDIIETNLLKSKHRVRCLISSHEYHPIFNDSLNQIIFCYYEQNNILIDIYISTREYWNHKTNICWNNIAISYVCLFLMEKDSNIKSIITFCKYANLYSELFNFTRESIFLIINEELKKHIEKLEKVFYGFDKAIKEEVSNILFDYYINYSKTLSKIDSSELIFDIENKLWFTYINEYRKIKYLRLKALGFKSIGNKSEFYNHLDNILSYSTPYALFSYYANKAAQYYDSAPDKAYELLSKCPFNAYREIDLQMLQLWIENDFSIILFYLNSFNCSKKSAKVVLQKSQFLSYDENIARSYNIIALNELKNDNYNLAKENFYNAIIHSLNCNNDSILHFSVNYLNLEYNNEIDNVCYNYFKVNEVSFNKIFNSDYPSKRLLLSLISYLEVLKKHNENKFNELYNIFVSAVKKFREDGTECKINGQYYVLF